MFPPIVKKIAKPFLGLIVGLSFFYLLFRHVDIHLCLQTIRQIPATSVLLAVVALLIGYSVRCARWWYMIRIATENEISYLSCLGPFFSSFAMNNVLPFRTGDAIRTFAFSRKFNTSSSAFLGVLVVERIYDLTVLTGLVFALIQILGGKALPADIQAAMNKLFLVGFILAAAVILAPRYLHRLVEAVLEKDVISRSPIATKALSYLGNVLIAIAGISSIRFIPQLLIASILGWVCEWFVFVCLAYGLMQAPHWSATLAGFTFGTLATLLPGMPGHLGTFDFFASQGLQLFGFSAPQAVGIALLSHLVIWAPITLIGMGFLLINQQEQPKLKEESLRTL